MPQVRDGVKSTVKFTIDAATLSVELNDASSFPDPTLGQYWIWIWDAVANPNAVDDDTAERFRVTGKTANVLTVVRGEAGQTAIGHAANQACRMLVDEANTKCIHWYDVTAFGGDAMKTGVTLTAVAQQAAWDAAQATGHPVYYPAGVYFTETTVTWKTGGTHLMLDIRGESTNNTILLDGANSSTRCWDMFEENLVVNVRDITFKNNGGTARDWIRVGKGNKDSTWENVTFNGQGVVTNRVLHLDDSYQMNFMNCKWVSCVGTCVWAEAVRNAGNYRFVGCFWNFCRTGFFCKDGATLNSCMFMGCKFVYQLTGDWATGFTAVNDGAGPWSLGTISIFIGTGRDQFVTSSHAIVLHNDNFQEVTTCSAYNNSTGVATLTEGLKHNWTGEAGAEIFVGSPAIVIGRQGSNLNCIDTHFENAPVILAETHASAFTNCNWVHNETAADGNGTNLSVSPTDPPLLVFGVYISGSSRAHGFYIPRWTTDRADEKLVWCGASAGPSSTNPGDLSFTDPIRIAGGSPNPVPYPATMTNQAQRMFVQSRDELRLGQDQADSTRWGIRNPENTAETEIRQMRSGARFFSTVSVSDANYGFKAGKAADDGVIVMTSQTAIRTVTLPVSPPFGRECWIVRAHTDAFDITVGRNGQNIMGSASDKSVTASHQMRKYTFVGGTTGWHEVTEP